MTVLIIQSVLKEKQLDGSYFLHKNPLSIPEQLIASTQNKPHSEITTLQSEPDP